MIPMQTTLDSCRESFLAVKLQITESRSGCIADKSVFGHIHRNFWMSTSFNRKRNTSLYSKEFRFPLARIVAVPKKRIAARFRLALGQFANAAGVEIAFRMVQTLLVLQMQIEGVWLEFS